MNLTQMVDALLAHDMLTARQLVADANRCRTNWSALPQPTGLVADRLTIAAAICRLLADRQGQSPPAWTETVAPLNEDRFLVRFADRMPHLRDLCRREGPEALRRYRLFAPPDFLQVA